MPNPLVTNVSEPISEVQKVTTITEPVGSKDSGGTQIDPASMARTPVIYNVTLTNANTEYSQALPANCKKFSIHLRDFTAFRFAYVAGKVAAPTAPYLTVPEGSEKAEELIQPSSLTLYFASSNAGKIAEIEAWA